MLVRRTGGTLFSSQSCFTFLSSQKISEGTHKKVQHLHGPYKMYAVWNSSQILVVLAFFMCTFAGSAHRRPLPILQEQLDVLQYIGPLPKTCDCSKQHAASTGLSSTHVFNTAGSSTMGEKFWIKFFTAGQVALSERSESTELGPEIEGVLPPGRTWPALASVSSSWSTVYELWKNQDVTRQLLREFVSSPVVDAFISRETDNEVGSSSRSLWAKHCTHLVSGTSSPLVQERLPSLRHSPTGRTDGFVMVSPLGTLSGISTNMQLATETLTQRRVPCISGTATSRTSRKETAPHLGKVEGTRWQWLAASSSTEVSGAATVG